MGGGGVRVSVIEELKFLRKFTKKKWGRGVGGVHVEGGGQVGCERRIEVIVEIKKNNIFFGGGSGRWGGGQGGGLRGGGGGGSG